MCSMGRRPAFLREAAARSGALDLLVGRDDGTVELWGLGDAAFASQRLEQERWLKDGFFRTSLRALKRRPHLFGRPASKSLSDRSARKPERFHLRAFLQRFRPHHGWGLYGGGAPLNSLRKGI